MQPFWNELVGTLTREFRVSHHLKMAYFSLANGTVERVRRNLLRAARALCSEWKLIPKDGPAVLECIQSVLNGSPIRRLGLCYESKAGGYRSPLELCTGQIPVRPLLHAPQREDYTTTCSTDAVTVRQVLPIEKTHSGFDELHKEVSARNSKSRLTASERHNPRTNVKEINFELGYYFWVHSKGRDRHKVKFVSIGPRRIIAVESSHVLEVERWFDEKQKRVHARRMIRHKAANEATLVHEEAVNSAMHTEMQFECVNALRGIRKHSSEIELLLQWDGLPGEEGFTSEPLFHLKNDVRGVLHDY